MPSFRISPTINRDPINQITQFLNKELNLPAEQILAALNPESPTEQQNITELRQKISQRLETALNNNSQISTPSRTQEIQTQQTLIQIHRDVQSIIQKQNKRSMEDTLKTILTYLKNKIAPEKIQSISISYNNQNIDPTNDPITTSSQVLKKTENRPTFKQISPTKSPPETIPEEFFSLQTQSESTYQNKSYYNLISDNQLLGFLTLTFKKETSLSESEKLKLQESLQLINNYLAIELKQRRFNRRYNAITRIIDRSGTQNSQKGGFETGLKQAINDVLDRTSAERISVTIEIVKPQNNNPSTSNSYTFQWNSKEVLVTPPNSNNSPSTPPPSLNSEQFLHFNTNSNPDSSPESQTSIHKLGAPLVAQTFPIKIPISDDINATTHQIGTITIESPDISDEDQNIYNLLASKLSSAVSTWLKDYNTMIKFTGNPNVAMLYMRGLLTPASTQNITMVYSDIKGFTAISEKFHRLAKKLGLPNDQVCELVTKYEALCKQVLGTGGVFDKNVGDCTIMHFGAPFQTNSKGEILNNYGQTQNKANPHFTAINALKTLLRIKQSQSELDDFYHELIMNFMRNSKKHRNSPPRTFTKKEIQEFCHDKKLPYNISLTQGFSTGEANIGFTNEGIDKHLKTQQGISYTAIGDKMNLAARLQSAADEHHIMIDHNSKELIENAIAQNLPIPFDEISKPQTWSEFCEELLAEQSKTHRLIPIFLPITLDVKNKAGDEFAYRFSLHKIQIPTPTTKTKPASKKHKKISKANFLKSDGFYTLDQENINGRTTTFFLTDKFNPNNKIYLNLPSRENNWTFIPEQEIDQLRQENTDNLIQVRDGKIIFHNFESIEIQIQNRLTELTKNQNLELSDLPHTIYEIISINPSPKSEFATLRIRKGQTIFTVKIDKDHVRPLSSLNSDPDAKRLFEIHKYPLQKEKIRGSTTKPQYLFIHVNHIYIGEIPNNKKLRPNQRLTKSLQNAFPDLNPETINSSQI